MSTFLWSFAWVFWKKALNICKEKKNTSLYVFWLFWYIGSIIICIIYFANGMITIGQLTIPWYYIGLILVSIFVALIYRPLNQKLNQEEKLATLVPFSNLNKIFSLTLSFLIFKDVSLTALLISLSAVLIIVWASIDLKHFSFPKNFKKILIIQSLISVRYIIMSRCILQLNDKIFYVYDTIFYTATLLIIVISSHTQWQIKQFSKRFYLNRMGASIFWAISTVISLYLISELWATTVLLLWFLNVALQIIIAYFYLGEKPSKKDIILTVVVSVLVAIWFYFK
jgi:drug/metabolite transporter (DMT)-like permease